MTFSKMETLPGHRQDQRAPHWLVRNRAQNFQDASCGSGGRGFFMNTNEEMAREIIKETALALEAKGLFSS